MVQGVDSDLFRPDDELKKLAKLAVQLGVAAELKVRTVDEVIARLGGSAKGRDSNVVRHLLESVVGSIQ